MSASPIDQPNEAATLVVAIDIADPVLADRVTALFDRVEGARLAEPGEVASVTIVAPTASTADDPGLTPRELEVLALLTEGLSNKSIARRLGISVHTAKFHVASLIDKLDAIGRTDAVAHAARRGVIQL